MDKHSIERQRLTCHWQWRFQPASELVQHFEILEELSRVALWGKIALDDSRIEFLQHRAVGVAASKALRDARRVDARRFGENDRLGPADSSCESISSF